MRSLVKTNSGCATVVYERERGTMGTCGRLGEIGGALIAGPGGLSYYAVKS
jgi:hypothetical protein